MKLEIVARLNPISIDSLEAQPMDLPPRDVIIDGVLVPRALADIILLGFDVAAEQYTQSVLAEARRNGLVTR